LKANLKNVINLFLIPENLDYQNLLKLAHLGYVSGNKIQLFFASCVKYNSNNLYINNQYSTIMDFEKKFKLCYILSSNLKLENILLNVKVRTKYLKSRISIFSSGFSYSTNFPNYFITLNVKSLFKIFESKIFLSFFFLLKFALDLF
jgi:hypothetical protein